MKSILSRADMSECLFSICILISPACITIGFVRVPVSHLGPGHQRLARLLPGLAFLLWTVLAILVIGLQHTCTDPPDPPDPDISACAMQMLLFTFPVLSNTAIVYLYLAGNLIWNAISRVRDNRQFAQ